MLEQIKNVATATDNSKRHRVLRFSITMAFFSCAFCCNSISAAAPGKPDFSSGESVMTAYSPVIARHDVELLTTAIAITVFLLLIGAAIRLSRCESSAKRSTLRVLVVFHVLTAVVVGCLCLHPLAAAIPVLLGIAGESFLAYALARFGKFDAGTAGQSVGLAQADFHSVEGFDEAADFDEEDAELEHSTSLPENCSQTLQRFHSDEGETITGRATAKFSAVDRLQTIHIAFCPPLHSIPETEVFQISGPAASVRKTLVEKFGMRLEVKAAATRSEKSVADPAENEPVAIEFVAHSNRAG